MRIGIDISQIVYEGTGVAAYVRSLVTALIKKDKTNTYVLFGASLRKRHVFSEFFASIPHDDNSVKLVIVPLPPTVLDILWNQWGIAPIEWITGQLDVFWSSDWTQPPLDGAMGMTTIHDVSFLRYPETFAKVIVEVQKRRLVRAKKFCQIILCDSEATKKDLIELLDFTKEKLTVVYPGLNCS